MRPYYIRFYAKDGSEIGGYRKRYAHNLTEAEEQAAAIARGIDLRTRRQTAGTDSRKVARWRISTS